MIIYLIKVKNKIMLSDKEIIIRDGEPLTIGFPAFEFELKPLSNNARDIFTFTNDLQEGKSIKMVLKMWPIE